MLSPSRTAVTSAVALPLADQPTLMIVDARGEVSVAQLVALADAIHPG